MPDIQPGRHAALVDRDIVVFLIGARFNRLRNWRGTRMAGMAMDVMMRTLHEQPELGLLHAESFRRGRTTLMLQYWESHEKLQQFATSKDLPHAPAWAQFMREVADSGAVGIWHETYLVPAGNAEAIYGNMPIFGLAAATQHVPVGRVGERATERLAAGR